MQRPDMVYRVLIGVSLSEPHTIGSFFIGGHVYEKLWNSDCYNISGTVFVHVMNEMLEMLTFLLSFVRSFICEQ